MKAKSEDAGSCDVHEDDIAMGDDRTGFLISEFKPDLFQLAVMNISILIGIICISKLRI